MSHPKDEKINLLDKEDVLMLFHEIKTEHPSLDELSILSAVSNVAGWDTPPTSKQEGKKIILQILRIQQ